MFRYFIVRMSALIIVLFGVVLARYAVYDSKNGKSFSFSLGGVPPRDFPEIKTRGKIVALTDNSSTSYFVYKGEPMGFEYELLHAFASAENLDLVITVAKDMNRVFEQLNRGEADIIAANLTVTKERKEKVSFTSPLLVTRQVLIQRKPAGWEKMPYESVEKKLIRNPVDLAGKNVCVRRESSFYTRLKSLSEEIGGRINIVEVPGKYETEELISMVADGKIDYTVADENVALINQTYYPGIDIKTAISLPQQIAWAARKDAPALMKKINAWIKDSRNKPLFAAIYSKYFRSPQEAAARRESGFFSPAGGKISVYDDLIRMYSAKIGWDWRLLASLIYQESHFCHDTRSWTGAYGLMQIIPATSARLGIDSLCATPLESIRAGTVYLACIDAYWKSYIPDSSERIKFTLASYNVGTGHIIDARNLALKYGRNSGVWDGNVAYFILQKSKPEFYNDPVVRFGYCRGSEPFNYVKEILLRFEHYKNATEMKQISSEKVQYIKSCI